MACGPGKILWEVQEAYQPGVVSDKLTRGPLEYAALWQVAQRLTDRPVKFGAICAPALASMLWNEFYADDKAMILDLCDIMNAEFRELADSGCPLIQVEEPPHHGRVLQPRLHRGRSRVPHRGVQPATRRRGRGDLGAYLLGQSEPAARVLEGAELRAGAAAPAAADCDVITFECASTDGQDLPLFKHIKTDKKIGIGVVNHCNTVVEPPEYVAALIRKALEYIPPERLVITTDCGFGREGLSRRIAYYKCVALVEGTNIVRRELGLPEVRVRAADPKLWFAKR